jgi:hypothetical protein
MREIPKGPSSADQQRASQANTSNSDSSSPSSASNIGVGSDGVQVGENCLTVQLVEKCFRL